MPIATLRSYRATIVPKGTELDQIAIRADAGTLPTVQLKETNAARAAAAAFWLTGLPVFSVERIDGVPA